MTATIRYVVGASLAVGAGALYNIGVLVQKKAVNSIGAKTGSLMAHLVKNRLWLLGLGIQFLLGTPLYAAAQLFIGPTLIPGLMATGLIVLALGSPLVAGEPLRKTDLAAVGIIVVAVGLLGLSRLSVDLATVDLLGGPLVLRFCVLSAAAVGLALALVVACASLPSRRGTLLIIASGLVYALGNLWLGVVMTVLARFAGGDRQMPLVAAGLVSLAMVIATNLLSVVWTQRAFRHGKAASLVPLQQVPIQIIPALSYFVVFLLPPAQPWSPYLALGGIGLVILGSALLGAGSGEGGKPETASPA
jgi:hypothetical protein